MNDETEPASAAPSREAPLTEHSPPGVYAVITASGTLYRVEISSDDRPVSIMRFPIIDSLLKDGTWLPVANSFRFDADTGMGEISWEKDDPASYDHPDLPYVGATRTTTRVHIIARIGNPTEEREAAAGEDAVMMSTARDDVTDLLRQMLAGLATHENLADFIEMLQARDATPVSTSDGFATPTPLTNAEIRFAESAGVPSETFSADAADVNDRWAAESAAATEAEMSTWPGEHEVAALLGVEVEEVQRLLTLGDLVSVPRMGTIHVFPPCQFTPDGTVVPGLRELIPRFPADYHPLDVQSVMSTPAEELAGSTPAEWLVGGGEIAKVEKLIDDLSRL